ncbi:MAG: hypothetical protein L6309_04790, partial [Candidatus Omnitrophica bacterium]|nr:hypothetical protein [Candidatus Omnitrophota bacterium]
MKNSADSLNAPLKAPKTPEKISADIERDIIIKRHGIARILTAKETNEIIAIMASDKISAVH